MKQYKIIRAYKTLSELSQQKVPLSVSHKLWTVSRMLKPHWDFQTEKEMEIIKKYNPNVSADGTIDFGNEETAKKCKEEFEKVAAEMADLDVDLGDYKKVVLHFDDKLEMSVEDMDALSEFIDFVE